MEFDVTGLLLAWRNGDQGAFNALFSAVHNELHRIAHNALRNGDRRAILQTTAIVNEAYLRLVKQKVPDWESRAHFFAFASRMMRGIVIDYVRKEASAKRGGGLLRITFGDVFPIAKLEQNEHLIRLDDALTQLLQNDERKGKVVEMRFFGGMTLEEIAVALGCSVATVKREWTFARAWLAHTLEVK
jgi:RNA polymerase sigma-70 factor, ECF subfamily